MKNYDKYKKCKIEIDYENFCCNTYRKFYWRINPKELSFWDRIFLHNPWRIFKHALLGDLNYLYTIKNYNEQLKNIVTYEDAVNYQRGENAKAKNKHDYYVEKGIRWGF